MLCGVSTSRSDCDGLRSYAAGPSLPSLAVTPYQLVYHQRSFDLDRTMSRLRTMSSDGITSERMLEKDRSSKPGMIGSRKDRLKLITKK
jgi:hypothetical protein